MQRGLQIAFSLTICQFNFRRRACQAWRLEGVHWVWKTVAGTRRPFVGFSGELKTELRTNLTGKVKQILFIHLSMSLVSFFNHLLLTVCHICSYQLEKITKISLNVQQLSGI